jgi:hypothetical protein
MSGAEVVGLLLGVFPLIISAMEHYEDVKKPTVIWWKIRRAHKRDYGKVKDCEFAFMHQLRLLLYPMLDEDLVDQEQHDKLLADIGGDGWKQNHIVEALLERLGDRHDRYLQVLEELGEAMEKLCKATKVDDPQFQKQLEERQAGKRPPTATITRANMRFQAQRLKYSFTDLNRVELLAEVEDYIRRLSELLSASDELAALPRKQHRTASKAVGKKVLDFWTHADNIFQLIRDTWHCNCRSSACLWLQQNYAKISEMRMHLGFCHGSRCLVVKLSDRPPTIRLNSRPKMPSDGNVSRTSLNTHGASMQICQHGLAHLAVSSQR